MPTRRSLKPSGRHGIGSSSSAGRRKRKKKRKKKLPKTSSSCGRARRRQWQWHVPGPCALQRQVPAVPRVHCVSLRHVVDVPVVRFVQFPQVLFFGFYACPVEKASRSKMNVPQALGDEVLGCQGSWWRIVSRISEREILG